MSNMIIIIAVSILASVAFGIIIPGRFVIPHIMIRPNSNPELEKKVESLDYVIPESIAAENRLEGYVMDQTEKDNVIIFFGGINESAAFSVNRFDVIRKAGGYYDDYDIVVIDWPEFGNSEGKACMESLKNASCEIVEDCKSKYSHVVIIGYSMGTGYATYAASKCNCDKLVLLAPYNSSTDLVNHIIGVFRGPFEKVLSYRLPVYKYADEVKAPVLIVASRDDKRVPFKSSMHLAENFRNGCTVKVLRHVTHAGIPVDTSAVECICRYLAEEYAAA